MADHDGLLPPTLFWHELERKWAIDPARFDHWHPLVGPWIARNYELTHMPPPIVITPPPVIITPPPSSTTGTTPEPSSLILLAFAIVVVALSRAVGRLLIRPELR